MPHSYTPRGFAMYADFDYSEYPGEPERNYTVQESSLATEYKVWVGPSAGDRAHLGEREARIVRDALDEFLGGEYATILEALENIRQAWATRQDNPFRADSQITSILESLVSDE